MKLLKERDWDAWPEMQDIEIQDIETQDTHAHITCGAADTPEQAKNYTIKTGTYASPANASRYRDVL
jgi:hypothetical protein